MNICIFIYDAGTKTIFLKSERKKRSQNARRRKCLPKLFSALEFTIFQTFTKIIRIQKIFFLLLQEGSIRIPLAVRCIKGVPSSANRRTGETANRWTDLELTTIRYIPNTTISFIKLLSNKDLCHLPPRRSGRPKVDIGDEFRVQTWPFFGHSHPNVST